ncbi:glycosyltransferase family 4 protein [Larkinella arboricola]
MKIFVLVTQVESGGAQRAAIKLVNGLNDEGHNASIWFFYKKTDSLNDVPNLNILLKRNIRCIVDYIIICYKFYSAIRSNKPNAVIAFTHYANILGLFIAFLNGVKIRVASHRNPSWGDMNRFARNIDNLWSKLGVYSKITAVSESTKRSYNYYSPKVYNKIAVINNGLAFKPSNYTKTHIREQLSLPKDKCLVGTIGRHHEQKNQLVLLKAISLLKDIHLVILGDGELRSEYLNFVKSNNIADRVHFIYELPANQISSFLKALDIYAMPSIYEGLSNALVEALWAELPIICSDIDAQKDVITSMDGDAAGIILPASDEKLWASAIYSLSISPSKRALLSEKARLRANHFTIKNMINGFVRTLC